MVVGVGSLFSLSLFSTVMPSGAVSPTEASNNGVNYLSLV